MNTPSHDFVTVDMRGLKAALVARAQADRSTVSVLVRRAVARELGLAGEGDRQVAPEASQTLASPVKLSIRISAEEVSQLDAGARAAGLSRPAYLAGLIAQVPVLTNGGSRADSVAALVAATAELADLSRDIRHLTSLLAQGEVQAARVYRARLDQVAEEARAHVRLASQVLADLQPSRVSRAARTSTRN